MKKLGFLSSLVASAITSLLVSCGNGGSTTSGDDKVGDTRIGKEVCQPTCDGKQCGDDGCGGSCGSCGPSENCTESGDCGPCQPQCDGIECGPDMNGCNCPCPEGAVCEDDQTCCYPDCAGKTCGQDNGCGGTCGGCPSVGTCCGKGCVELASSEDFCGTCDTACGQGEYCVGGKCTACTPACADKACGSDGCGGNCGQCAAGTVCVNGKCDICIPGCGNNICGPDGCGGSCGECPEWQSCTAGSCSDCAGTCEGKKCGDSDGCGGKCDGPCPGGGVCAQAVCQGQCVPNCVGKECGNDGCGGSCGSCLVGSCTPSGKCECISLCKTEGYQCGWDGCDGSCGECPPPGEPLKEKCGAKHFCIPPEPKVGCSDSTREGFSAATPAGNYVFPDIASCAGSFDPQNLRATKTAWACGNDIGKCNTPADLCAEGWHICMNNGWPGDLGDRISEGDCHSGTAGQGAFLAGASGAVDTPGDVCVYEPLPLPCQVNWDICCWPYVGTIACGSESDLPGVACPDAVWAGNTPHVNVACNNADAGPDKWAKGVLCCKDPKVVGH